MRKYPKNTFKEVLNDCSDAYQVRRWLDELVSNKVKKEIVKRFNEKTGERK